MIRREAADLLSDPKLQLETSRQSLGTLDNCFIAMMNELMTNHGFSEREAYIQMSVNPGITARTYQFIRPQFFTVGMKFEK